ncbi:hypothetical protein H6Y00_004397, partial [Escherichia coli]|nr:hypothetical protein [Escherichia coli]
MKLSKVSIFVMSAMLSLSVISPPVLAGEFYKDGNGNFTWDGDCESRHGDTECDTMSEETVAEALDMVAGDSIAYTDQKYDEMKSYVENNGVDKSYVDAADAASKKYADQKAATAEQNAKNHADSKAAAAESNANAYTDSKFSDMQSYVDNSISNFSNGVDQSYVDAGDAGAKSYADQQANNAEDNANVYTDSKIKDATNDMRSYTDNSSAQTLVDANTYTDT